MNKFILMSSRLTNILRYLGIKYLKELEGFSEKKLFSVKHYGPATNKELSKILSENNIKLKEDGKNLGGMWLNKQDNANKL